MHHQSIETIPQRAPFVFVDRILDIDPGKRIVGIKNLSYNEPFFQGNIPDYPVMPSSLFIECMTQTASALIFHNKDLSGRRTQFQSIKKLSFLKEAIPGDQLRIEIELIKDKESELFFSGRVLCEGSLLCEGDFSFQITEIPSKPKIHSTASVHPTAVLGKDVTIGPYTIVGEQVFIGDGTNIEAHVMIEKWTKIGENNNIHFGTVIGSKAQDGKYVGEKSWVIIGDNNEIREYVTINRATGKDAVTVIATDI